MFSAKNMSRAARQAAKANGMNTVQSYEIMSHFNLVNEDDSGGETVVIRAYNGSNHVDITARDIFYFSSVMQDAPMARV